eukprot:1141510-Pelagomonas_calceolata.AAC.2
MQVVKTLPTSNEDNQGQDTIYLLHQEEKVRGHRGSGGLLADPLAYPGDECSLFSRERLVQAS